MYSIYTPTNEIGLYPGKYDTANINNDLSMAQTMAQPWQEHCYPGTGQWINKPIKIMRILKIENIKQLLPNYGDHWTVLSETQPDVEYDDINFISEIQPNLWYHMDPETIPDTFSDYFLEKLNIPQPLATAAVMRWNHMVENDLPTEVRIAHVFHINGSPLGILLDPEDPRRIILMTPNPYLHKNRVHIKSGRGYMWVEFNPAQLGEDTQTIDHIKSLFAVEIEGAIKIIKEFNRYLKMGGNL